MKVVISLSSVHYWARFENEEQALPHAVQALIRRIDSLNVAADVGLRRCNLPALLAKYFFDMKAVIGGMYRALKPARRPGLGGYPSIAARAPLPPH